MSASDRLESRRAELLRELSPRARLVQRSLELGGRRIELLSVNDIDPLLAELEELEHTDPVAAIERLPYWASLWPSSVALARFLLEGEGLGDLAGIRVIELGCGAGLGSVAARLAGARVLATDHLEAALRLCELNFLANGLEDFQGRLVDWRSPPADLAADLILCSDVAYERESLSALASTLEVLSAPGGRVLLAEPLRPVARALFDLLDERGWRRSATRILAPLDGREVPVDIHLLSRGPAPAG